MLHRVVQRFGNGRIGVVVFLAIILAVVPTAFTLASQPLPAPTGKVLLTVIGAIEATNVDDTAQFDRDMLASVGMKKLDTKTPWEDGVVSFEGPLFSDLLSKLNAKGKTLVLQAIDGYQIDIPFSDIQRYDVLLAMKRDGKWMGIRDKGPIWLIYPLNTHPELNNQIYSARSIWQLNRVTVQ